MKKIWFVVLATICLSMACYAEEKKSAYGLFIEATAKAYVIGERAAKAIGKKAKEVNNDYEITDNIDKFIKKNELDKKAKDFGKSADQLSKDLKKQIKKEEKLNQKS